MNVYVYIFVGRQVGRWIGGWVGWAVGMYLGTCLYVRICMPAFRAHIKPEENVDTITRRLSLYGFNSHEVYLDQRHKQKSNNNHSSKCS